jgi:hypothetical protein
MKSIYYHKFESQDSLNKVNQLLSISYKELNGSDGKYNKRFPIAKYSCHRNPSHLVLVVDDDYPNNFPMLHSLTIWETSPESIYKSNSSGYYSQCVKLSIDHILYLIRVAIQRYLERKTQWPSNDQKDRITKLHKRISSEIQISVHECGAGVYTITEGNDTKFYYQGVAFESNVGVVSAISDQGVGVRVRSHLGELYLPGHDASVKVAKDCDSPVIVTDVVDNSNSLNNHLNHENHEQCKNRLQEEAADLPMRRVRAGSVTYVRRHKPTVAVGHLSNKARTSEG